MKGFSCILRIPEPIPVGTSEIFSVMEQRGADAHPSKSNFSLQFKCIIFPHVPVLSLKYNADWVCN